MYVPDLTNHIQMEIIDLRTVFFNFIFTDFISLVFLTILWYQNRNRYKGLHLIAFDFLFHFISISLIFLRGYIPDFVSIVIANCFSIVSGAIGLIGFGQFIGYKIKAKPNFLVASIFIAVHIYFTLVNPNLTGRNLNLSMAFFTFCIQTAWILLYKTPVHLRKICRSTGIIFLIFSIVNLARIMSYILFNIEQAQNYFQSGIFEKTFPFIYEIILLMMSFFIVLMVNKRLIEDISTNENKLSVIFQSVPYAIIITEKRSGKVLDINKGFEQISGYSKHEVIGKSTFELQLWNNPIERNIIINELNLHNRIDNLEFQFRKSTNEIITGQISSIQVLVHEKESILSAIIDVTNKKKSELELKKSHEILKKIILNLQAEHEQEKISLATQLDNNLNQSLASLRINIGILKKKLIATQNPISDEILHIVDNTYQQSGVTIERSLSLMNKMRNEVLYLLGFEEAISYAIEEIEKNYKVTCVLVNELNNLKLEQHKSTTLFLAVQEILIQILNRNNLKKITIKMTQNNANLLVSIFEDCNSLDCIDNLRMETIAEIKEKLGIFNGLLFVAPSDKNMIQIIIEMPIRS